MIHKDGNRWEMSGRKIAYLKVGAAKGVITSQCNDYAKDKVFHLDYCAPERTDEFKKAFDEEYKRFVIVEYVPKT
ncbi:hypothetical protein [Brevibacillus reuszeri]|uniref:hypothetical protein n=1 Tax=Brevibacillus reuszeri TaxID=54915 RepID=UPI001141C543|nr:hypothetical protein [Brevibacillus reuszeri]